MSGGYDRRGPSTSGSSTTTTTGASPGKGSLSSPALPRTTAEIGPIPAQVDPVAVMRAMIARGEISPGQLALVLRANPGAARELTSLLDTMFGPAYARFVVAVAQDGAPPASPERSVGAPVATAVAASMNADSPPASTGPAVPHALVAPAGAQSAAPIALEQGSSPAAPPAPTAIAPAPATVAEPSVSAAPPPAIASAPSMPARQEIPAATVASPPATRAAPPITPEANGGVAKSNVAAAPVARLDDPALVGLAAKIHDPKLPPLLSEIAAVLALNQTLRTTRTVATRFEVKGNERAVMVDRIGVVRAQLAALGPSEDPNVAAFRVAINHRLEEIAPYHFQLNIPTIESAGGWSTCNLTSLAMCLEVLGIGASSYPVSEHEKLLAVANVFKNDIAQARLAAGGTDASLTSLMGLRFPDFLELAAVVEFVASAEPGHDEIVAAAVKAVLQKKYVSLLIQLAHKFGAKARSKTIHWDATKTARQNLATDDVLNRYGGKYRGNGDHGVEQLSTARNAMEKETNPNKKQSAMKRYESLLAGQASALEGKEIEGDLSLDAYKSAVIRDLGPELDAGAGVLVGVFSHWTRLYGLDDEHILVQDPGAWNRTEINITWAEARAMGYFWTNLVVT